MLWHVNTRPDSDNYLKLLSLNNFGTRKERPLSIKHDRRMVDIINRDKAITRAHMAIKFDVVEGETEHISFSGQRTRKATVLMRLRTKSGTISFSKKAATLGLLLIICQCLDGLLTYIGLRILGVQMEGNSFLRELMHAYGMLPALFVAKFTALLLVGVLMFYAHKRKWIRPIILLLSVVYLSLAVIPWIALISKNL